MSQNFVAFSEYMNFTAEGIRDRYIVSSIKSKVDDLFFVHLLAFVLICRTVRTMSGSQLVQNM